MHACLSLRPEACSVEPSRVRLSEAIVTRNFSTIVLHRSRDRIRRTSTQEPRTLIACQSQIEGPLGSRRNDHSGDGQTESLAAPRSRFEGGFMISTRSSHRASRRLALACTASKAPPGFEPGMKVLQTSALPLGYGAGMPAREEIARLRLFS
jgi:hypothetical protein